ncbi:MAG: pilin [Candidatus Paceibacterota bacterium]|jgi:type IV secretory pathway VirB2 component (pilin)
MKHILFTLALFSTVFFTAVPAMAACDDPDDPLGVDCGAASGLSADPIPNIAARIINVVLGLLGTIAVVLIVYAGFKWMTAGGKEEQVTSAKETLSAAVIGLVIILAAYAISSFVLNSLYGATTNTATFRPGG